MDHAVAPASQAPSGTSQRHRKGAWISGYAIPLRGLGTCPIDTFPLMPDIALDGLTPIERGGPYVANP